MPDQLIQIENPASPNLDELCTWLADQADSLNHVDQWPGDQLLRCANQGVFRWFVPVEFGGAGWSQPDLAAGYLKLGASCLTTTFVITQWVASVKRILASENQLLKKQLIPDLLNGSNHTTVGISHLTTSRRHLSRPVLRANEESDGGFLIDGYSPWVTAAPFADTILVGATLESGDEVLLLVDSNSHGVSVKESQALVALSASRTGSVGFEKVSVPADRLVAGPGPSILTSKGKTATGSLQTSTLALALSRSAVDFVIGQANKRPELTEKAQALRSQWDMVHDELVQMSNGNLVCSNEDLRTRANSLALRSTQAALLAARGSGFVQGHPVGRWCREALFFLVWSCPQSVQEANLCELAGIQ